MGDLCEILDTVVELTSGALDVRFDHDTPADTMCEIVEYPKKRFRFVVGVVFVYGHKGE